MIEALLFLFRIAEGRFAQIALQEMEPLTYRELLKELWFCNIFFKCFPTISFTFT